MFARGISGQSQRQPARRRVRPARGFSTDREEFIAGLNAAAVPVKDAQGQTRAAIAIHAPSARMSIDDAIARLPALQAAAARIAELL